MDPDKIPFVKAHGARNDFLLTWNEEAPAGDLPAIACAICERHTGIGADGWMLVGRAGEGYDCAIRLFNSDGSEPEISGNGTRCAAAFLIDHGFSGSDIRVRTGAGVKELHLIERSGLRFVFDMNMGHAEITAGKFELPLSSGAREVTLVAVGNPQCVVPVADFDFDWRAMGAEIERHPYFPNRTNVSFIRPANEHALEVRFWERGAGETMSSGTGSTGAVAAALARGMVKSPVEVLTPAGPLSLRHAGDSLYLTGPAEIIASGVFFPAT
ncbi:MAG: diaminopimelate epimerase [Acidobacteria bacterium]|nr:diaminopimelate epimerase [Acidobacteriota bacterium]